jgi:transposase-like protein
MPRPYPPEFRRRALDLVESGRTVRDVAASLGIAESCLHRWRHRDLVDRGLRPGTTAQESAELAAARASGAEFVEGSRCAGWGPQPVKVKKAVTVTDWVPLRFTRHVSVVSASQPPPDQPAKELPVSGVAVSWTIWTVGADNPVMAPDLGACAG